MDHKSSTTTNQISGSSPGSGISSEKDADADHQSRVLHLNSEGVMDSATQSTSDWEFGELSSLKNSLICDLKMLQQ